MTAAIPAASVGRVVHYRAGSEDNCHAAIVTYVHSAWNVNLEIFGLADGDPGRIRTSVTNVDGARHGTGWHWPERVG